MRLSKRRQVIKNERAVQEWNERYPVGTEVILNTDTGVKVHAVTRSTAHMLDGLTPVVLVAGLVNPWPLDRVTPGPMPVAKPLPGSELKAQS